MKKKFSELSRKKKNIPPPPPQVKGKNSSGFRT
jgi:hypothetical protein